MVYIPDNCFKNILAFCGEPLPPNKTHSHSFNCKRTQVFYRENGRVKSYTTQLSVKCKKCNKSYLDTGYAFCGPCYNVKCIECGGSKTNPMKDKCNKCLDKTKSYTCKCCDNKMDKKYLYCYSCKYKQTHQRQDQKTLKYYRCCPCGASLKDQPNFKRVCIKCYKIEKNL